MAVDRQTSFECPVGCHDLNFVSHFITSLNMREKPTLRNSYLSYNSL